LDLVLANPPYYSHFRIAKLFVDIAVRALKSGGTLLLVTKTPEWYLEYLPKNFTAVSHQAVGNYWVVTGQR
jgi:16S rRNA (guanine1207-N2)-methyltransferase